INLSVDQTWTANNGSIIAQGQSIALNSNHLTIDGANNTFLASGINGSGGIIKNGSGELVYAGVFTMSYAGPTVVNAGTFSISKITGGGIQGPLIVGDGIGGANADVVNLNNVSPISASSNVTVNSSGYVNVNITSNTLNMATLTVNGGNVAI